MTIVGARPQFIKAAALSRVIQSTGQLREYIVHTGQHFDDNMSEIFFRELSIPVPWRHLGIGGGGHGAMTGRMLIGLEELVKSDRPDAILVYGDTNSTLAGAITAAKMQIPLIHVEAGLRSFNRAMPEEINRLIAD
jgi:UDP-GlcNAc3NAcA epimerase